MDFWVMTVATKKTIQRLQVCGRGIHQRKTYLSVCIAGMGIYSLAQAVQTLFPVHTQTGFYRCVMRPPQNLQSLRTQELARLRL